MRNLIFATILFFLNACAPISDIKDLRTLNKDNFTGVKIEEVHYSEQYRGMVRTITPKSITTSQEKQESIPEPIPLFNNNGQKVRTQDEAAGLIKAKEESLSKTINSTLLYISLVWIVPVGIVTYVVDNILGIPVAPLVFDTHSKIRKESYQEYRNGNIALKENNAKLAKEHFLNSLSIGSRMAQDSDIYFKLAQAYKQDGNVEQAKLYFERLLDYSVRLYPEYFEKYDSSLKNNYEILVSEFQEAEKELKLAN